MVGHKRSQDEISSERAGGGSAGSSKRGRCWAGGTPVYECTICGKACSSPSKLTRHMRTHTGDRPYECTTCGQTFSQSSDLTRHMRTHTGEQPYVCKTCGLVFSFSSNMTKHMKIHPRDEWGELKDW